MRHLLACAAVLLLVCAAAPAQDVAAPKTGSFETTFEQRSPHSEMKSLTKRLAVTDAKGNYNLSAEPCLVYVPEHYNPAKPMGLIVLLNYKASSELPTPVLPQLAEVNCAVVVPKNHAQPMWARAGLALDVAHDMAQRYKIDPRRVYIFGFDPDSTSQRLCLNYPEVFTGGFWLHFEIYRAVKSEGGGFWNPKLPKPDPTALAVAKTHPFVLSSFGRTDQWERWANSFKQDGFRVQYTPITQDQAHYPNYTTDWLPGVIKFLDDGTAKLKPPATKPATTRSARPAAR